ncbi:hypothetical protein [Corynebacterium propinquum]
MTKTLKSPDEPDELDKFIKIGGGFVYLCLAIGFGIAGSPLLGWFLKPYGIPKQQCLLEPVISKASIVHPCVVGTCF